MHARKHIQDPLFEETLKAVPRQCDHPGCDRPGEHRAPKSRYRLHEYFWFCLDHVRDYNKSWNYYAGMNDDEVEACLRYDTCWQRPTWPMGSWQQREAGLRDRVYREFGGPRTTNAYDGAQQQRTRVHNGRPLTEEEKALAVLDLEAPVEFGMIKARYRALVKQHHPDANGGSREAEEKLKSINLAYSFLKLSYAS
jgi:curved DNA-binding protein CbpA